ncbi:MAG: hypothetical protein JWP02_1965 [Acidimicrobiales bacterium]|nr:hypothetical protein [Acidimicrobiales bacterium]
MSTTLRRIIVPVLVAAGLMAGSAFHPARAATPAPPRLGVPTAYPLCIGIVPSLPAICIPR